MMDQVDFLSIKIGEKKKKKIGGGRLNCYNNHFASTLVINNWFTESRKATTHLSPVHRFPGERKKERDVHESVGQKREEKLVCVPHSCIHPLRLLCTKFIPTVKHAQKGTSSVGYQCVSILIDLWEYERLVPSYFFDSLHMLSITKFINW